VPEYIQIVDDKQNSLNMPTAKPSREQFVLQQYTSISSGHIWRNVEELLHFMLFILFYFIKS
jgi:hypothetical protein